MLKRLLCVSTALTFAPWALVPARADRLSPVTVPQMPAITGGDVTAPAASAVHTVNTVKGKTVLPIDGTTAMTGALQGIGGNSWATTGVTPAVTMTNPTVNFGQTNQQNLINAQYGPNTSFKIRAYNCAQVATYDGSCGALPQVDVVSGTATVATGTQGVGQVSAIAGYATSDVSASANGKFTAYAVAGYFNSVCTRDGCNIWGLNPALSDTNGGAAFTGGTGVANRRVIQNEYDLNVFGSNTVAEGSNVVFNIFNSGPTVIGYNTSTNTSYPGNTAYNAGDYAEFVAFWAGLLPPPNGTAKATKNVSSQSLNFSVLDNNGNLAVPQMQGTSDTVNGIRIRVNGAAISAPVFQLDNLGTLYSANGTSGGANVAIVGVDASNVIHIGSPASVVRFENNNVQLNNLGYLNTSGTGAASFQLIGSNSSNQTVVGAFSQGINVAAALVPGTAGSGGTAIGTSGAQFGTVWAVSHGETLTTPSSSTAACTAGQFGDDANYHYVCTATNTWKRAALSAF